MPWGRSPSRCFPRVGPGVGRSSAGKGGEDSEWNLEGLGSLSQAPNGSSRQGLKQLPKWTATLKEHGECVWVACNTGCSLERWQWKRASKMAPLELSCIHTHTHTPFLVPIPHGYISFPLTHTLGNNTGVGWVGREGLAVRGCGHNTQTELLHPLNWPVWRGGGQWRGAEIWSRLLIFPLLHDIPHSTTTTTKDCMKLGASYEILAITI